MCKDLDAIANTHRKPNYIILRKYYKNGVWMQSLPKSVKGT
jgi:hypothetical protein